MTAFQYTLFIIFAVIFYMISVDKNVSDYISIMLKLTGINIQRLIWMIKFHPRNPITNFIMARKYERFAKELEKEFQDKNK